MTSRTHSRLTTASALLLFTASIGFVGCKKGDETAAAPPTEVTVAEVEQRSIPIVLDFSGTLKAVKSVAIIPRVSGYVEARYFEEGSFVDEGDPLYLIDPRPFKAALQAAQAQLAKSRADAKYLDVRARRYTALAEEQVASLEMRDEAVSKASENRAQIKLDIANVQNAKLNLGYTKINAPFAGRIQQTRINEGELITAQETVLTELLQIQPIYAIFSLSRAQMFQIQQHSPTGMASDDDGQYIAQIILSDKKPYEKKGTVDFLSAQVDPTTDMLQARAVFENTIDDTDNMTLIPGQYVPVRLDVGEQPDAILVPEIAVMETQVGRHVFVVNAQNEVVQQAVDVDRAYEDQYVLKSGSVKTGDRVIIHGAQKVRPGATVKPLTADADAGVSDAGVADGGDAASPLKLDAGTEGGGAD